MKIAISTDNNTVASHFGRCPEFTFVTIENNAVTKKIVLKNPGHEPGRIPQFLHENGASCIITGGMGMRAIQFFQDFGIKTIIGIQGDIDEIIKEFIAGTLVNGETLCKPGAGKGYGLDKTVCDHPHEKHC